MDRDGTREGFDLELTRAVSDAVGVPVVASGGVGTLQHLVDGVVLGGADAVLAASIFHFREHTIAEAKALMASAGRDGSGRCRTRDRARLRGGRTVGPWNRTHSRSSGAMRSPCYTSTTAR